MPHYRQAAHGAIGEFRQLLADTDDDLRQVERDKKRYQTKLIELEAERERLLARKAALVEFIRRLEQEAGD